MTHDDLLIEINRRLDVAYYNGDPQSMRALRAAVELHKPIYNPNFEDSTPWCWQCADQRGYAQWPCPTIQAIEKELG